ncbi:translocation/assembly module TamB domain-containing protein [Calidifontimicrobium sp. SYSU G02091]|uniref:translocation/assembly module TamB domain-containing protein n=1 Tax=Calidifontimicrobium sp. SYSU G02091 TaxID=2926421 RepID=UPI001F530F0D|nr:translocation/assembly module TamB domain-containing protein [Calidifontimicrobium sp. SYSU G02091]MCI1193274.1 translocation/assembly module TamB domain-containing protein [Calidifontimicrobium sp. SYSU G02091]
MDPTARVDAAPPPRRTRAWRVLLVLALGLPLALVLAVAWLAGSSAGTAWLLAQVPGLQVSGVRGALAGGAFEAARVQWSDGRARLVIEQLRWADLVWRWRPHDGAWVGVDLLAPQAQRVEWRSGPARAEPLAPPRSLALPLQLRAVELRVDRVEIDDAPPLQSLDAALELGADGGRVHRLPRLAFAVDGVQLRAQAELATGGELPLRLALDARSAAPAWQAQAQVRGPLQRLDVEARAEHRDPPAALDLRATLLPFAPWPLAALQMQADDVDLAVFARTAPRTRLSGRVEVRSRALDAPFEADVEIRNAAPGRWDVQRLPLHALKATLRARLDARDTVELTAFEARLGGASGAVGRWSGRGRWHGTTLDLDTRLTDVQPAALDARAPAMTLGGPIALQLQGLPSPDASAARDAAAPLAAQLRAQLAGRVGALPAAPPVRVDASVDARVERSAWQVDLRELRAVAGEATARVDGRVARHATGWTLATRGELARFDPLLWWPGRDDDPLWRGPHRLDARWQADFALPPAATPAATADALAVLRGRAEVQIADSLVAGVPLSGTLRWAHADGGAPQVALDADVGGNRVALRGDGPGAGTAWRAEVDAPRLAALAPLARLAPAWADAWPRAGTLQARARADGRWPALRTDGELELRGVEAMQARIARAQARWSLALDAAARPDEALRVEIDAEGLARGEQTLDVVHARIDGSLRAHRIELDAASPLRPPAWTDAWLPPGAVAAGSAFALRGEGRWLPAAGGGGRWHARIDDLHAAPRDAAGRVLHTRWVQARALALQLDVDAAGAVREARVEPGRLQLLDAALRWRELRWSAAAPGAGATMALDAEVEPLDVAAMLARLYPDFGAVGDLRVGARVQWRRAEKVEADVVIERLGGDLALAEGGQRQALGLTDLRLALAARDGVWEFTQALAGAQIGVLAGAQRARSAPSAPWPGADASLDGVVELRVANVGVWAPWLPAGWRLGGELHTSATLGGRLGAPEYRGEMTGSALSVRNVLQGVDVRDGVLRVTLAGEQARIETLRLRAGDGSVEVTGGATFGEAPRAQLQLVAERFQLLGRVDRRLVVSGRADAALTRDALRLDGRFGVDRGLIDFTRADAPALDDDVTVVRRGEAAAPAARPRAPQRRVDVRLAVDLGRELRLRGRGLDTLLRGELALTTPGGRPALTGTVRAEDGTYQAYGQRLQIDRGAIVFTGVPDNPQLDILAVRPNLDVEVGVEIGGTAQAPRVRLYSDPAMPDVDKLSWLLLGREPSGLGRADVALLQSVALALLAGEGEGPNTTLMRALGIDELSVAQTENGTVRETVVTVGKQLSRRWYVAYERGVNAASGSWQLIYRAARRLTVRAQTGADTALDVIWTWRWR